MSQTPFSSMFAGTTNAQELAAKFLEEHQQQKPKRTALTEFGEYLSSLSSSDRRALLEDNDFVSEYSNLVQAFIVFLLTGDAGNSFASSSEFAKMQSEKVLASAKEAGQKKRRDIELENASLRSELERLRSMVNPGEENEVGKKHGK